MASKTNPGDWDRLFAPNAPRRGGPLRALFNVVVVLIIVAIVGAGATYGLRVREQRAAEVYATATAAVPTQTAAAQAQADATATVVAQRTATAIAKLPTATPADMLTAGVFNGGNVREQPVNGRPLDQVHAGETVQLLARTSDGAWYRVVTARQVTGWVSQTLLTIDPQVAERVPTEAP